MDAHLPLNSLLSLPKRTLATGSDLHDLPPTPAGVISCGGRRPLWALRSHLTVPYRVKGSVGSFPLSPPPNRSSAPASSAKGPLPAGPVPPLRSCTMGTDGHTCGNADGNSVINLLSKICRLFLNARGLNLPPTPLPLHSKAKEGQRGARTTRLARYRNRGRRPTAKFTLALAI